MLKLTCNTQGCTNHIQLRSGRGRQALYCPSCAAARKKASASASNKKYYLNNTQKVAAYSKSYMKNLFLGKTRREVNDDLKFEFIKSYHKIRTVGVSFLNQNVQYNGKSFDHTRIQFVYKDSSCRLPSVSTNLNQDHFSDYMGKKVPQWALACKNNDIDKKQKILDELHTLFDGRVDMEASDNTGRWRIPL